MEKLRLPCARRGNFRGGWESWSKNVILTFSVTIWVWTLALSPLSCIPFIQLLSILLWFIKTEKKDMHSLKVFFELRAYTDILELLLEFSYLLYYQDMQYAHWSYIFCQLLTLADFYNFCSQLNNLAVEVLLLCQNWRKDGTYFALPLCRFCENI